LSAPRTPTASTTDAHLAVLGREPRPAGSEGEERARVYAEGVLRDAGFGVRREPFVFSAFPGRYATPIGGALAAAVVLTATWIALADGAALGALVVLMLGVVLIGAFAASMLGDAVLTLPMLRTASVNVMATRGASAPHVWLVAHLDSKSQPVPSAGRVLGLGLVALALGLAFVSAGLQLAGVPARTLWWLTVAAMIVGAPLVMASVVGTRSDGAVDNASGVAAVLRAATMIPRHVALGVLLPSAEELGLAGARAFARQVPRAVALNCDGVDDDGEVTLMYSREKPVALLDAVRAGTPGGIRERRMPLGLLTDSVALADRGWSTVTVSRGSIATLRRVHTPADSLAALRGDGITEVATLLARAAEALAR
jgi:hypothetical protein